MDPILEAGLLSLLGVALGALLSPLTESLRDSRRAKRAVQQAKRLVAAELLQAQAFYGAAFKMTGWPAFTDITDLVPTSAWRENKAALVGHVDDDVWNKLVLMYSVLELDRQRFTTAMAFPALKGEREVRGLKQSYLDLGRLHKSLGGTAAFPDEAQIELDLSANQIER
jgi:hypothetical protein